MSIYAGTFEDSARATRAFLDRRVTDGVIRRMIDEWLNEGVLEDGTCALRLKVPGEAASSHRCSRTSSCTTCWTNGSRQRCDPDVGECRSVRFPDDFVMTFKNHRDAERVLEVLGKQLARYGLTLHPDRTRFVDSAPSTKVARIRTAPNRGSTSGLRPRLGEVAQGTERGSATDGQSQLARALLAAKKWCRFNRHLPILDQRKRLSENS